MKSIILAALFMLIANAGLHAQAYPGTIRMQINHKLAEEPANWPQRRSYIAQQDERQTTYALIAPYDALGTDEQSIVVEKTSGNAQLVAVYRGGDAVKAAKQSLVGWAVVEPGWEVSAEDRKNYTVRDVMSPLVGGGKGDTLFYKGIAVAALYIPDDEAFAVLSLGVLRPTDRAAAASTLPKRVAQPWNGGKPGDHLSVAGTVITVQGWGENFDGAYDVAKLAKDSCLSGDCTSGKGRKVLAAISTSGEPRIRIMDGRFRNNVFLGGGVMLVDGEGPKVDGTYEIRKWGVNYRTNDIGAKCTFHPKGSQETLEGQFNGYFDDGIGAAFPSYRKYVVQRFVPTGLDPNSAWKRDVDNPYAELSGDIYKISDEYRQAEAKRQQDRSNYAALSAAEAANAKCTCCGGRGRIVSTSFNHAMASGINYMKYQEVPCNCCGGTGHASNQTQYKANTDGGANLDYRH